MSKKLNKTEQWLKGQSRQGSKLRDLLPTLKQYHRMPKEMQRKYTRIMQDWKSNSPSRKGRALDRIQKYYHQIPGQTMIQQVLGGRIIANLESVYQQQQEDYFMNSYYEAPGDIYRQGKPGAGYGVMRQGHFQKDKHGHVVGARTAKQVSKMMIFRKLDRDQLTVSNFDMKDFLEGVEFYDNGNEQVAVASYRDGKTRFVDVYNKSTDSTETIAIDLERKGFPRNTIDWENPRARKRDNITGW